MKLTLISSKDNVETACNSTQTTYELANGFTRFTMHLEVIKQFTTTNSCREQAYFTPPRGGREFVSKRPSQIKVAREVEKTSQLIQKTVQVIQKKNSTNSTKHINRYQKQ